MSTVHDVEPALAVLARHADNPSAFLALNRDVRHFSAPGIDGLVAFRPAGRRFAVQLGAPVAHLDDRGPLLRAFCEAARRDGRHVVAVQLLEQDVDAYCAAGFRVNQLGCSYSVDLGRFTLAGTRFVKLRNKIARARRSGVEVAEVRGGADPGLAAALDGIDRDWLRSKGRGRKEIQFLVGERRAATEHLRRVFVARCAGEAVGYVSYVPAFGPSAGWLHDLSRRSPDAPPGVMELVNTVAIEAFRAEGATFLHLGLTPFTGLDERHERQGCSSPTAGRLLRLLAARGERVYPARTQLAYKLKWSPHVVRPEFIAFSGRVRLHGVWQLLRLTRAV